MMRRPKYALLSSEPFCTGPSRKDQPPRAVSARNINIRCRSLSTIWVNELEYMLLPLSTWAFWHQDDKRKGGCCHLLVSCGGIRVMVMGTWQTNDANPFMAPIHGQRAVRFWILVFILASPHMDRTIRPYSYASPHGSIHWNLSCSCRSSIPLRTRNRNFFQQPSIFFGNRLSLVSCLPSKLPLVQCVCLCLRLCLCVCLCVCVFCAR